MKYSKRIVFVAVLMLATVLGLGVSAEEVELVGTDDGEAIFDALVETFNSLHPEMPVGLGEDIGSTGAIKCVGRGEALLGRVARPIRAHEKHYGLVFLPIAKTAVVFFTNPQPGIHDLTTQNILDIYSGTCVNWSRVGGPVLKIRVLTHEEGDSSLEVLEEKLQGFSDISLTPKSKTVYEDEENIELAETITGAIAYGSYSEARAADVTIVRIDGNGVLDADYPYMNTLGVVYKESNMTETITTFLDFLRSDAAREAIEEAGGMPVQ